MNKYSKLPGIRSLHDFVFTKNSVTNKVVAKIRKFCYTGRFKDATIHVVSGRDATESVIPNTQSESYNAVISTMDSLEVIDIAEI